MSVFNPLTSKYATQLFASIGKSLYLNSESADVQFVFESNGWCVRVPAHKAHLMAGSDVFATMFNGSWKENKEVRIGDSSATAFKEFLQFFYFGQVKLRMENVAAVMNLGEMYNVAECLAVCKKFLKNNLNGDNVCRSYNLAILFNQDDLKKSCKTFIRFNTNAVLKSTGFLACNQEVMAEILTLDWLSCTEVELFEACMARLKAVSKQNILTKELVQNHLGNLLHKIRFASMSLQTFVSLIPTYGSIFSVDEYQEIMQMIANSTFQPTILDGNRVARCDSVKPWNQNRTFICCRFLSDSPSPYHIKNVETTVFSTIQTLLLCKFRCSPLYGYVDHKYRPLLGNIPTNVTIVEVDDSKSEVILYNSNETHKKFGTLTKPILVRPGFTYEIRLKQTPPVNCCTKALMKSRVKCANDNIIQFHRDPVHVFNTFLARGLIDTLYFQQI